jgi:hypothetical protein
MSDEIMSIYKYLKEEILSLTGGNRKTEAGDITLIPC